MPPPGMSLEDVPAVVNITTLKGRLIVHTFNTGPGEDYRIDKYRLLRPDKVSVEKQ